MQTATATAWRRRIAYSCGSDVRGCCRLRTVTMWPMCRRATGEWVDGVVSGCDSGNCIGGILGGRGVGWRATGEARLGVAADRFEALIARMEATARRSAVVRAGNELRDERVARDMRPGH